MRLRVQSGFPPRTKNVVEIFATVPTRLSDKNRNGSVSNFDRNSWLVCPPATENESCFVAGDDKVM